jgi:hypothetical protein
VKETWTRKTKVARTGLAFVALFGVALQGLISTPQGLAGGTATVSVQANVLATCSFTTTSATLNFGNLYQGSAPPDVTATASLTFRCTSSSTAYTITDNNGLYYDAYGWNAADAPRDRNHCVHPVHLLLHHWCCSQSLHYRHVIRQRYRGNYPHHAQHLGHRPGD